MKVNKVRLGIFVVLIVVVVIVAIMIFSSGKEYSLVIRDAENITSVISQKNTSNSKVEVSSKDLIQEILNGITNERITKTDSTTDTPACEEYYIITFMESGQIIYVYNINENYYIEEAYNGIYDITKEEYDQIMQYLYF